MSTFSRTIAPMVQQSRLIIYTDLDGSLLDHDSYNWQAALPALASIRQRKIPLIPCSSKTFDEIRSLQQQLDNPHPFIFENGCGVAIPEGYFEPMASVTEVERYVIHYLGLRHAAIQEALQQIQAQTTYRYEALSTLSAARISQLTGLAPAQAALAARRHCSEPLLWYDSEAALEQFTALLADHGLRILQGGRMHTVVGHCDKGQAIRWLQAQFHRHSPTPSWTSLGLGDSQNDLELLNAVDHPVVVANPHINQGFLNSLPQIVKTQLPGPAGWNQAVMDFMAHH